MPLHKKIVEIFVAAFAACRFEVHFLLIRFLSSLRGHVFSYHKAVRCQKPLVNTSVFKKFEHIQKGKYGPDCGDGKQREKNNSVHGIAEKRRKICRNQCHNHTAPDKRSGQILVSCTAGSCIIVKREGSKHQFYGYHKKRHHKTDHDRYLRKQPEQQREG